MFWALLLAAFLAFASTVCAAEPEYPRDVSQWKEATVPSENDRPARTIWSYAANYSRHEWHVFADQGKICAELTKGRALPRERPGFFPKTDRFRAASSFAAVDDGWLVGFNQGEWGGALYWYSKDDTSNYKISDDQIVDFFSLPDGLYAIEGLAHLGRSQGSVIRIFRPEPGARWQASTVTKLPQAPYAVSVSKDGTMLITLSASLVSIGKDRKVNTLLPDAPWDSLYPNSSALSNDGQKLYIGMRQYVGEFDLRTKKLRLLIPSDLFLHKLPEAEEKQLRSVYGGSR